MEKANIAVLGSGGFGLSLAVMMDKMGHDVTVWSKFKSELDDIRRDGENKAPRCQDKREHKAHR